MSVNTDVRLKPNKVEIGERIAALMKDKKLNDSPLAQLSGFSRSYIADVRNGRKEPPIELLFTLKAEYDAPIAYILLGEKKDAPRQIATVQEPSPQYERKGLPYYGDIVATGGTTQLFTDTSEYPTSYILAPGFEDCDGHYPLPANPCRPKYDTGILSSANARRILTFFYLAKYTLSSQGHIVQLNTSAAPTSLTT